jgi:hypothetical protein
MFGNGAGAIGGLGTRVARHTKAGWVAARRRKSGETVAAARWTNDRILVLGRAPACDATLYSMGDPCAHPEPDAASLVALGADGSPAAAPRSVNVDGTDLRVLADGTVLAAGNVYDPSVKQRRHAVVTWNAHGALVKKELLTEDSMGSFRTPLRFVDFPDGAVYAVVEGEDVGVFKREDGTFKPLPSACGTDSPSMLAIPVPGRIWVTCGYGSAARLRTSADDGARWSDVLGPGFSMERVVFFGSQYALAASGARLALFDASGRSRAVTLPTERVDRMERWQGSGKNIWFLVAQPNDAAVLLHTTLDRVEAMLATH